MLRGSRCKTSTRGPPPRRSDRVRKGGVGDRRMPWGQWTPCARLGSDARRACDLLARSQEGGGRGDDERPQNAAPRSPRCPIARPSPARAPSEASPACGVPPRGRGALSGANGDGRPDVAVAISSCAERHSCDASSFARFSPGASSLLFAAARSVLAGAKRRSRRARRCAQLGTACSTHRKHRGFLDTGRRSSHRCRLALVTELASSIAILKTLSAGPLSSTSVVDQLSCVVGRFP